MPRNTFIFGIGGTGSRVVRSLTMLLASGVKLEDTERVIPILIDLDTENADTLRTVEALDLYKIIRDQAYTLTENPQEGFFAANLCKLSTLRNDGDTGTATVSDTFQLKFNGISNTFENYLDFNGMADEDKNLLRALYDDSPENSPHTELKLNLTVGFKGNPNIGSVVFSDLVNTAEYKYFKNQFKQGDRIFIISSIFGGTGSSGFPQLLKLLRDDDKPVIKQAKIGAVTVMPYFKVDDDAKSSIKSQLFISKTKAALSYYEATMDMRDSQGKGLNDLYYLYDDPRKAYQNKQGGREQRNDAHLIELLAASAVVHFVNKPDATFTADSKYHEFAVREDASTLDMRHFYDWTKNNLFVPLTKLAYFTKLHLDYIPNNMSESFASDKGLKLNANFNSDMYYQSLTKFFNLHFKEWLKEMTNNERRFVPFGMDASGNFLGFNSLVNGKTVATSWSDLLGTGNMEKKWFDTAIGKIEDSIRNQFPADKRRYMETMRKAADQAFTEKLEGLPSVA